MRFGVDERGHDDTPVRREHDGAPRRREILQPPRGANLANRTALNQNSAVFDDV